jgi:hypothetical protein
MDFERRAMVRVFKKKASPTMFLSSRFQSPDSNKFDSVEIPFDIKRNDEDVSVDIVRGTEGRNNVNKRFTTKTYTPPVYDEFANYSENERLQRAIGRTEYDENSMADVIAAITDDQVVMQDKILRAIELQAANAMFTGTVPLINYDTVDFKVKATHKIAPAVDWSNAAGVPVDDLAGGALLNRTDGLSFTTDAIFGTDAFNLLLNNDQFKEKAAQQWEKVDNMNFRPPVMNSEGANFHGRLTIGDWVINVWTYPQFYKVPEGYGLANEGTKVPYVPTDKVWLGSFNAQFDLLYAGITKLVTADPRLASIGITNIPQTMKGDFHIYGGVDTLGSNVIYGVKSAPMAVLTDVDSFCIFTVK